MKTQSKKELAALNTKDLKAIAKELSVKGSYRLKGDDLIQNIIKAQRAAQKASTQPAAIEGDQPQAAASQSTAATSSKPKFKITAAMKKILASAEIGKSEKFRKLKEAGMPTARIAEATESPYSFVFTALKRKQNHAVAAN